MFQRAQKQGTSHGSLENGTELSCSQWSGATHPSPRPRNLYLLNEPRWVTHPFLWPRGGKRLVVDHAGLEEKRLVRQLFPPKAPYLWRGFPSALQELSHVVKQNPPEFRNLTRQ